MEKPTGRRIDCRQTVARDKRTVTRQTDQLMRDKHVDEQHTTDKQTDRQLHETDSKDCQGQRVTERRLEFSYRR